MKRVIDIKISNVLLIRKSLPQSERLRFDNIIEQILRYETDTAKRNLTLEMNFLAKNNIIAMNGQLNTFEDVAHMTDRLGRYANQTAQPNPVDRLDPRIFAHILEHELLFGEEVEETGTPISVHVLLRPYMNTTTNKSQMAIKDRLRSIHDNLATILSLPGSHACSKYRLLTASDTAQANSAMIHYQDVEHRVSLAMQRLKALINIDTYHNIFDTNDINQTGPIDNPPSLVTIISQKCVESLLNMEVDEYGKPES